MKVTTFLLRKLEQVNGHWQNLRFAEDKKVHYLHAGKCGGTYIKRQLDDLNRLQHSSYFCNHPHSVSLGNLPPQSRYFFSIRNPLSRFASGFFSRQRKGLPEHFSNWSLDEAKAFARFDNPDQLALSLFDSGRDGEDARSAVSAIFHLSRKQVSWFDSIDNFLVTRPPVWIVRQEQLVPDLRNMLIMLGMDRQCYDRCLDDKIHANPYGSNYVWSDLSVENLTTWYAQDFQLYARCEKWLNERTGSVVAMS
jgi:hypothetical protein